MSKALKIMTFNLQQLPWLARTINSLPIVGNPGGSPEPDPVGRARAVVRAILNLPVREQPDIIAFNEAFSETARPVLISRLRAKYPHIIEKLDHPGADVEEDSGLMLFSKLPFLPLAGSDHVYKPFSKAAGNDAWVAKGVGIVRVNGPFERTMIAFTHAQASYDAANTEHAEIRAEQFAFIRLLSRRLRAAIFSSTPTR